MDTEPLDAETERDALLDRLGVIEDQPLRDRAEAYSQLHEQLRHALENGDRAAQA